MFLHTYTHTHSQTHTHTAPHAPPAVNKSLQSTATLPLSLISTLPCFSISSVIAIKAPDGTALDVPSVTEPDGTRRFQMYLKSQRGSVDVYLVKVRRVEGEDLIREKRLLTP